MDAIFGKKKKNKSKKRTKQQLKKEKKESKRQKWKESQKKLTGKPSEKKKKSHSSVQLPESRKKKSLSSVEQLPESSRKKKRKIRQSPPTKEESDDEPLDDAMASQLEERIQEVMKETPKDTSRHERKKAQTPKIEVGDHSNQWLFDNNPYYDTWKQLMAEMPEDLDQMFDPLLPTSRRAELFDCMPDEMPDMFAWAIPDERALRILAHFSPIVEMGAGKGYWGSLLRQAGVDYIGYDNEIGSPEDEFPPWTEITEGGPENLAQHSNRTLFLCYPDDFKEDSESLALASLKAYDGQTLILAGEIFGDTLIDNPWGKAASPEFQEELAANFYKVLHVPLPSWPGTRDVLTVWRRNRICQVDDMVWRYIPPEERLETVMCAPSIQHLVHPGK